MTRSPQTQPLPDHALARRYRAFLELRDDVLNPHLSKSFTSLRTPSRSAVARVAREVPSGALARLAGVRLVGRPEFERLMAKAVAWLRLKVAGRPYALLAGERGSVERRLAHRVVEALGEPVAYAELAKGAGAAGGAQVMVALTDGALCSDDASYNEFAYIVHDAPLPVLAAAALGTPDGIAVVQRQLVSPRDSLFVSEWMASAGPGVVLPHGVAGWKCFPLGWNAAEAINSLVPRVMYLPTGAHPKFVYRVRGVMYVVIPSRRGATWFHEAYRLPSGGGDPARDRSRDFVTRGHDPLFTMAAFHARGVAARVADHAERERGYAETSAANDRALAREKFEGLTGPVVVRRGQDVKVYDLPGDYDRAVSNAVAAAAAQRELTTHVLRRTADFSRDVAVYGRAYPILGAIRAAETAKAKAVYGSRARVRVPSKVETAEHRAIARRAWASYVEGLARTDDRVSSASRASPARSSPARSRASPARAPRSTSAISPARSTSAISPAIIT